MKKFMILFLMLATGLSASAQTGLKINELFEGRIIPQERMVETRVRGKTLEKYQLSYYRSVRMTVTEEEADQLLQMVEEDGKEQCAIGHGGAWKETVFGKEHTYTWKTQVRKQGDQNCFLCYHAKWKNKSPEREVTVIYMEGSVRSLNKLEELLK